MVIVRGKMMEKIALVTGASRGIGASVARLLARDGFTIAVNYRAQAEAAAAVISDIEAAGGKAFAAPGDVAVPQDVEAMFAAVDAYDGTLSVLVNNAGIHGPRQRIEDLSMEDLRQVLNVNVLGLIHCSKEAMKRMSTRHGGAGG